MKINNLKIGLGVLITGSLLAQGMIVSIALRRMVEEKYKENALKEGTYLSTTDSINRMMEVTEYYSEIWNYEWED